MYFLLLLMFQHLYICQFALFQCFMILFASVGSQVRIFFFFIQMSLPLQVFHKIFTVPCQGPSFYPVSKESFLLFLSCAVNLSFYRITAYLRCTSNWMLFQFLRVLLSRFPSMLSQLTKKIGLFLIFVIFLYLFLHFLRSFIHSLSRLMFITKLAPLSKEIWDVFGRFVFLLWPGRFEQFVG